MIEVVPVKGEIDLLKNFAVRVGGGFSLKFVSFLPLAEESPAVQLTAALLRSDRNSAIHILSSFSQMRWGRDFRVYIEHDRIASLIYNQICKLELQEQIGCLRGEQHQSSLSGFMRSLIVRETTDFTRMDRQFTYLLEHLGSICSEIVWEKGIVLSRSLYARPQFRVSGDFDIIIHQELAQALLTLLESLGFQRLLNHAAHCRLLGVGPADSISDLLLVPASEFIPCSVLSLHKDNWPMLEIKFDPLDHGLAMKERQRFDSETISCSWNGLEFHAPSTVDHLLMELVHFHKHGFLGWQWLFDIHLLIQQISTSAAWDEFVRRCKVEGVETSAWAGLVLAENRLNSPVPAEVVQQLRPSTAISSKTFTYTINPQFEWNSNSLFALLLSARYGGDGQRKLLALKKTLVPASTFIAKYYSCFGEISSWKRICCPVIHWLILLLPAGAVRRTFGALLWRPPRQSTGQAQGPG